MGKLSNVVRDSKVLKGLLVALPFLSFTVGAEMAKAAPQTKSSQKKLSRAETIQQIKKARLAKAKLAKVHTEKEMRLAKARLVRKTQLKKTSARFVKTAAKTTGSVKAPTTKQAQVGKTAAKTGPQKTVVAKKVQPSQPRIAQPRIAQPRIIQTKAATNPNKMYARLEAKIDQALNIVKRQAASKQVASKSSSSDATLASAVNKLGEMLDFFKKQADKKAEKDLVKKVMRKMEKKAGGGVYMTQQQPTQTSLAQSNVPAPKGPQQGISSNTQTKAPVVQAKAPSTPEEIAGYLGFDLNKTYTDGPDAVKILGQKIAAKDKELLGKLEKIDSQKKPEEYKKLGDEYDALAKYKTLLTNHLNAKYPGIKVAEKSEEPAPIAPVKVNAEEKQKEVEADVLKKASIPVLKLTGAINPKGTLLDALKNVDDSANALPAKVRINELLAKGAGITEGERSDLKTVLAQLSQSAKKSAALINKQIEDINEKFLEKPKGDEKVNVFSKPQGKLWDAWSADEQQLFNQKVQLARELVTKPYTLLALIDKERLDRLIASNPGNKEEIKKDGTELLNFITAMKKLTNDLAIDLGGKEKAAFTAINSTLAAQKAALEKNEDVVAKKASPAKKFVARTGPVDADAMLAELAAKTGAKK